MCTETNSHDIIPFKNVLNETYGKDCGCKIEAVVKSKCRHITTLPFGITVKNTQETIIYQDTFDTLKKSCWIAVNTVFLY